MANENENNTWEVTNRRFVCYLDIMGFKDYISRNQHEDVHNMLIAISESKRDSTEIIELLYDKNTVFITNFSDSIIIFSKDNGKDSLDAITYVSALILADAAKNKIPIKGAISEGLLTIDKAKNIFFGQPLIDAYLLQENEVFYYGVVCHNSMEGFIEVFDSMSFYDESMYEEIETPLKSGIIKHVNLNWFSFLGVDQKEQKIAETRIIYFSQIIKDFKSKVSGKPRKYIDNTEAVFRLFYPTIEEKKT